MSETGGFGKGMFNDDERVVGTLPKNANTELWVTFKNVQSKGVFVPFIDIRETWFKDGPSEAPVPTGKGVMIREEKAPKLIEFILLGLKDGSIDAETAEKLTNLLKVKSA